MAAFELCLETGCDGFELDVRATSDQRLLVCHDPELSGYLVAETRYAQLLEGNKELCLLDDVLERYRNTAFLDIELKVTGVEQRVVDLIHALTPTAGFVISSFVPAAIERLHDVDPSLPLGIIFDKAETANLWRSLPVSHVMPHFKLLSERGVCEMHSRGKSIMPWTVNQIREMKRLADWGADALIGDVPGALCRVFGRSKRQT